jgi:methionyl-tRNA formyltransferase
MTDGGVVRTVAITQSDPFFTGRFFEVFLEEAPRVGVELVEVVLLRNFNESRPALFRRMARFYGPLGTARLTARYARATIAERRGSPHSVEGIAARHGVPVRALPSINDATFLESLAQRDVDVLLSVAAPEILREQALTAAPHVLNVHSGRLPDYRGMMPTFWALSDGADEVVVTVHEMAAGIDTGRVIAEFPVAIGPRDTAFDVSRNAKAVAGREVARLLSTIRAPREARPAPERAGNYYSFPTRADARRLRARGRRLL